MRIDLSIDIKPDEAPAVTFGQVIDTAALATPSGGFAIPQATFSSAPALEVRTLGEGKRIPQKQALAELEALGPGWRFETANELRALVDITRKNPHGAVSIDDSLHPEPYWTADTWPDNPSARVVVWFDFGVVDGDFGNYLARARAVRVAGQ